MKTKALVLAACMALMMDMANAQTPAEEAGKYRKADLTKAEKNYIACIQTANEGAVESALALVARMQMSVPEYRFEALEKEITKLTADDQPDKIRYKAYLVHNLLRNPGMFVAEGTKAYETDDAMFNALAARLQAAYLTMNGR